jgi:hypothetical protein
MKLDNLKQLVKEELKRALGEDIYPKGSGERSLIRGILSMLDDNRMEDREGAIKFLMSKTGADAEESIADALKNKSYEDLAIINKGVGNFLKDSTHPFADTSN